MLTHQPGLLASNGGPNFKPDIVFVLTDDLGVGGVGYNNPLLEQANATPTLNALAAAGIKLTSHYVSATLLSEFAHGLQTLSLAQTYRHRPTSIALRRAAAF